MQPVLTIDDKPWGKCYHLSQSHDEQVDLCEISRGGYSSIHVHHHKHNTFFVVSGKLKVILYGKSNVATGERTLLPGESFTVRMGQRHQFYALEDTRLVEVYYREVTDPPVKLGDIQRFSENGIAHHAPRR